MTCSADCDRLGQLREFLSGQVGDPGDELPPPGVEVLVDGIGRAAPQADPDPVDGGSVALDEQRVGGGEDLGGRDAPGPLGPSGAAFRRGLLVVRRRFHGRGTRRRRERGCLRRVGVVPDRRRPFGVRFCGHLVPCPVVKLLTIRDVYYVVNAVDPTTKEVTHVLVKRGNELHAPTETFLNARHIIMIENVGTSSEIAKLIRKARLGSPAATAAPASP